MRRAFVWLLAVAVLAIGGSAAWRFARPRRPRPPVPNYIRLDVVNGCGVARAGREVMREMLLAGFNVYAVRNDPQHHDRTVVVDLVDPAGGNARQAAAALEVPRRVLGFELGVRSRPGVEVAIDSSRFVDAQVVVGADFRTYFPQAVPRR